MINREEVAKKIRKIDEYDCYETAIYEIDTIIGTEKSPLFSDFLNRLADLIDPTCKLKIQDGHACCGSRGHILASEYEEEEDYWCFRPYCPDCGARVVRDHDDA